MTDKNIYVPSIFHVLPNVLHLCMRYYADNCTDCKCMQVSDVRSCMS